MKIRNILLSSFSFLSTVFIFSTGSVFASETPTLPYMKATDFTPFWKSSKGDSETVPASVAPFQFKNQSNQTLTEKSMKGHVSLVNFFFTSCGSVCPRLMSRVQSVQKGLASLPGLRIYSFSVMPEVDSPERLAGYAKTRKLNLMNWDLITGDRSAIYQIGREVFRADRNPDGTIDNSEFIHTQAIYLVDSDLHIRGIYQTDKPTDMELLIKDARRLVQ